MRRPEVQLPPEQSKTICLQGRPVLSAAEGRRKGRLPSPGPRRRLRGMACIVPGQDNKALPQPLPHGNPDRLLSLPARGEVRHQGGEATHPSDASTEGGGGGGKQGPTELSSSNWKMPGHKASPEPTMTSSQCSSTCWVLSLLPTSLPPCLGSPVPTDHPALSLAASRRALGLSNSCYIFCSNVHVTEERTEASFPPSPQGFIATNSFSFLSPFAASDPAFIHPFCHCGRVQGPSGEQGLRGRSCPATQAKGTLLKMILAMRPGTGISFLLPKKLAQNLLI